MELSKTMFHVMLHGILFLIGYIMELNKAMWYVILLYLKEVIHGNEQN